MSETVFRGPGFVCGSIEDGRVESMDGPSITYQGDTFPDVRFFPTRKDGLYPGRVPAFLNSPYVVLCDNIPQASGTATLAALQTIAAINTPFVLSAGALAQANGGTAGSPTLAPGIPLVPMVVQSNGAAGWTGAATTAIALDFGFTTGTTVAASASMVVNDATLFYPGQWIIVGGAGNSGKTLPLVAQVATVTVSTNTITMQGGSLNGVAAAAVTNAPIGSANLPGPLPFSGGGGVGGTAAYLPTSAQPYLVGGLAAILNPPEAITRCVSVTGVSGSVGGSGNTIVVKGFDVFGQAMSVTMNGPVGATTVYTPKAFKYFTSISSGASWTDTSHNYSVGISDTYGFNLRSDKYEYLQIFWNGAYLPTASASWTAAVKTNPSTSLLGDVRGTFQTGPSGSGTQGSATASNGSSVRLLMAMTVPLYNDLFGTPLNTAPIFGVTQA